MNVSILLEHINKLTPFNHAFEDDSVGLLIGDESNQVENLTVGHELEESLLEYCKNNNIDTVVTYHPPPNKCNFNTYRSRCMRRRQCGNIS